MDVKVLGFKVGIKNATLKGKDSGGRRWTEMGYPEVLTAAEIHARGGVPIHYRVNLDVTPIIEVDGGRHAVETGEAENAYFDANPGSTSASPDVGVNQNYEANKAGFLAQLGPLHDESLAGQNVSVVYTHAASGLSGSFSFLVLAFPPLSSVQG